MDTRKQSWSERSRLSGETGPGARWLLCLLTSLLLPVAKGHGRTFSVTVGALSLGYTHHAFLAPLGEALFVCWGGGRRMEQSERTRLTSCHMLRTEGSRTSPSVRAREPVPPPAALLTWEIKLNMGNQGLDSSTFQQMLENQ